tara:strand:+ start:73 stop:534 length:462 start_codon:yes stop_codon:yes gene_type:complete
MITKKHKNDELKLTLIPNKSSSVNENFIFFGFLSILCLTFGVGFFVLGATMILPFAGLEIIILILVLRTNRAWLNQSEEILLSKLYVKLKKGNKRMVFDRFLAKFSIIEANNIKRVFISTNKEKVEIGSFLNEEDKDSLIDELRKKVLELNVS